VLYASDVCKKLRRRTGRRLLTALGLEPVSPRSARYRLASTAGGRKSSGRSPESESWRRPHAQCRASQPSTTWVSKAVGACVVSAMCVVLAACGSSGSVTSNPSGPSAGGSGLSSGQMAKFTQCLRDHGVTIPTSPGNSPPSQSGQISSSLTAAFAACRSLMPAGGPQGAPGGAQGAPGGSG